VLSDEDDGNAYQQGQDDTDPDDLKQVPNSFSSGRKRPGIAFPNSCDQGGPILGEHFHCVIDPAWVILKSIVSRSSLAG
jgi:hypothetical protein